MRLVDVHVHAEAERTLYALLQERPRSSWISHQRMPSFEQHCDFVRSSPFRYWYLIEEGGEIVGEIQATQNNELGVSVFQSQQRKYIATRAIRLFCETHTPLPAIPAVRVAAWLAHVAPGAEGSHGLFEALGGRPVQVTYRLPL